MLRRIVLPCSYLGTIQLLGARGLCGVKHRRRIAPYAFHPTEYSLILFSIPTCLSSSFAVTTTGGVRRARVCCRDMVYGARSCAGTWQRRCVSSSYSNRIPCARFGVSTVRLARATGHPHLPATANIFLIDLRKSQRKPSRKNPKSIMASIITAHRAEAHNAKEGLGNGDAYTPPPLVFLFKTDDTKKQAARRQEQMDAHLAALSAFDEFSVCVLNGAMSRHWTRFLDAPTAAESAISGQAEDTSPTDAPDYAAAAAAVAAIGTSAEPALVPFRCDGGAPASPVPTLRVLTSTEGDCCTEPIGGMAAAAAASSSFTAPSESMRNPSEAVSETRNLEDGEEWEEVEEVEEVEVEEGDDDGGGADGGGGAKPSVHSNNAEAAHGDVFGAEEERFVSANLAAAVTGAEGGEKTEDIAAPSMAKKIVNTVWAHVKRSTPSGDSAFSDNVSRATTEVAQRPPPSAEEENTTGTKDVLGDGMDAKEAPRAAPNPVVDTKKVQRSMSDSAAEAHDTHIPDPPQRGTPNLSHGDGIFLVTAHENPSATVAAEVAATAYSTEAENPVVDLEEFDIDGPLAEQTPPDARESGAGTPSAHSTTTECGELQAMMLEQMCSLGVPNGENFATTEAEQSREKNASGTVPNNANPSREATSATAAGSPSPTPPRDAAACAVASSANTTPNTTASDRGSVAAEVEKNAAEEMVSATAAPCTSKPATSPSPVPPPKPSIPMPVYSHVPSRLYYAVSTVYLSDRAYVELPATANVLVIDHLDWDDAHLAVIDEALQQVDPVAGHVLLFPDAYAPQSEHVMGDANEYHRSLLPFVFVFRTQLSLDSAMTLQCRLTKALYVRPTVDSTAQQSLLAGKNDRTSVCVLSAVESQKGGENPMLAPQPQRMPSSSAQSSPRKPAPAQVNTPTDTGIAPQRMIHVSLHDGEPLATTSTLTAHHTSSVAKQRDHREGRTFEEADDAVHLLYQLLSGAPPAPASGQRRPVAEIPEGQQEYQRGQQSDTHRRDGPPADAQRRLSRPRTFFLREQRDHAEPPCSHPAEIKNPRTMRSSDSEARSTAPASSTRVAEDIKPSPPPRLSYAPSLLDTGVATPFSRATARGDAAVRAGTAWHNSSSTTLQAESVEGKDDSATMAHGLSNFGSVAFGKNSGYYSFDTPHRPQASDRQWGLGDADTALGGEDDVTDAGDGSAANSVLGSVSDLGLYPVSEKAAAAGAEAERRSDSRGGFTDEDIAKIEEDMLVAQVRRMEKKEQRMEERRVMREKADKEKTYTSSKTTASPSVPSVSSTHPIAKRPHARKQRWHRGRGVSDSSKATATLQGQELDEDKLLEDFVNSLLVTGSSSTKGSKAKKVKANASYESSQGVVHAPCYTSTTTASNSNRKRGKVLAPRV